VVRVIGLGTQNTVEEAVEFVRATGTTSFPMYWDETFVSWNAFGVTGQPAAALLSTDGEIIGGWLGGFDEDEVLRLAAKSSS
jgi:hypothetical protein